MDEENPKKTQTRGCYKGNKITDNGDTRLSNMVIVRLRWVTTQYDSALLLCATKLGRGINLTLIHIHQQHMVIHHINPGGGQRDL
jgi:hypothetical protein